MVEAFVLVDEFVVKVDDGEVYLGWAIYFVYIYSFIVFLLKQIHDLVLVYSRFLYEVPDYISILMFIF